MSAFLWCVVVPLLLGAVLALALIVALREDHEARGGNAPSMMTRIITLVLAGLVASYLLVVLWVAHEASRAPVEPNDWRVVMVSPWEEGPRERGGGR